VYCRTARRERVFAKRREAERFRAVLRDVAQRDGCAVLAGCWMPAHAHLVLRTTAVQLWRSMGLIQGRFARDYNRRHRVVFTRAAWLVRELPEARDARVLGRLHQRLARAHLLIVDELGFVPFERTGGELLFNPLAERHERRSTMITTNLAFSEWVQVLGDEKLTTALLDRLASRGHILTTQGPSYRTRGRP